MNVVRPGDVVVIGVNGMFGERMCDIAGRLGAEVVRVEAPWGKPLDIDELVSAHGSPSVVALVHAETSTGVRNEIEQLAGRTGEALVIVDCVTSLGGIQVEVEDWGVDIAYSATQKCLGVRPVLSPLTVSDRARKRFVDKPVSWYFDLAQIARYTDPEGTGAKRLYHHTAPVGMMRALHAGLGFLLDEGLEAAWSRHAHCGAVARGWARRARLGARRRTRLPVATAHYGQGSGGDSGWEGRGPGASGAVEPLLDRDRRRGRPVRVESLADRLYGWDGSPRESRAFAQSTSGGARKMIGRVARQSTLELVGWRIRLGP